MDPFGIFLLGIFMTSSACLSVGWLAATRRARRFEKFLSSPAATADRIAALEETATTLQLQLERMREDHAFLSKLLAERVAGRVRIRKAE